MSGAPAEIASELGDAERIAVAYAPRALQPAFRALLALDAILQRGALGAQEPILAQVRLAWWRDAIARLPGGDGHPLVAALAADWLGGTVVLSELVDAWETVAVDGVDLATAELLARRRAETFAVCAGGRQGAPGGAAHLWTLASLADHAPDPVMRQSMYDAAAAAGSPRLPGALRPLTVLDGLGRRALLRGGGPLLGDRLSPLVAMRLGIFGR